MFAIATDATVDYWNGNTSTNPRGGARKDSQSCGGKGAEVGRFEEGGAIMNLNWADIVEYLYINTMLSRFTMHYTLELGHVCTFPRRPKW